MNYLHNNKQLFSDILNACSEDTGIARAILDKDYFKKDYEDATEELLFDKVNYKMTKEKLLKIIEKLK